MMSFRPLALAIAMAFAVPLAASAASAQAEAPAAAPESAAESAVSAEKRALVEALLKKTGAIDLGRQVQSSMVAGFKQQIPVQHHALIDEVFAELDVGEIEGEIAALYARSFTEQELIDMLAFYETPSGRSMLLKMPALMQESIAIGQSWGAEKAKIVIERIREREARKGEAAADENDAIMVETPPPANGKG